jgi:hypothetical protein
MVEAVVSMCAAFRVLNHGINLPPDGENQFLLVKGIGINENRNPHHIEQSQELLAETETLTSASRLENSDIIFMGGDRGVIECVERV